MDNVATSRDEIRTLLANGLQTETSPRADTPDEREAIIHRLQTDGGDVKAKLTIAGFTLKPVPHGEFTQECETCMYFRRHDRHCELPELDLPSSPNGRAASGGSRRRSARFLGR